MRGLIKIYSNIPNEIGIGECLRFASAPLKIKPNIFTPRKSNTLT